MICYGKVWLRTTKNIRLQANIHTHMHVNPRQRTLKYEKFSCCWQPEDTKEENDVCNNFLICILVGFICSVYLLLSWSHRQNVKLLILDTDVLPSIFHNIYYKFQHKKTRTLMFLIIFQWKKFKTST